MKTIFQPRMEPNTPGRLKYKRTFAIGLAFMTSSIFWAYYNFMMPLVLNTFLSRDLNITDGIDTIVGVVMVLDNIVGILLLPVFGALSDRTRSRFGKRTPYIIVGAISGILAFSVIGFLTMSAGVAVFATLIAVIMWFNISMAFYRSASVSLMPDLTDPKVRPTGNAIINLMGALAMVFGLAIPAVMAVIYDTDTVDGLTSARAGGFYSASILTIIALVIFLLAIKETPTGDNFFEIGDKSIATDPVTLEYIGEEEEKVEKEPLLQSLKEIVSNKEDRSPLYMLIVIFSFFFGYNAIDTFYSLYATQYLGWKEGDAGTALLISPITMILTVIFAGKIAERIGRKNTVFIGLIGLTLTFTLAMFVTEPGTLMIVFAFIGIFFGFININTIVMIWEMAPKGKIGAYTGAYYFFSQLSATLSPVIAGLTFDTYRKIFKVADGQQYIVMFPYLIFWEIIAILFLFKVKSGEVTLSSDEVDELKEIYEDD